MNIEITVEVGKNEHDYHPVKSKSTLNVEGIDDNILNYLVGAMVADVTNKFEKNQADQAKRPLEVVASEDDARVL